MQASATFQRFTYSGLEPSLAFDVVYGGHFEHRLLSAKRSNMEHQRFVLDGVLLESGIYDFPVIARGAMPKNVVCIGVMAAGAETTRYNTSVIEADEIQIYPPESDLLYHASTTSRWINFIVPQASLQAAAIAKTGRPLALPKKDALSVRLQPAERGRLVRLADDAFAIGRRSEPAGISAELATGLSQGLIDGYVAALCAADPAMTQRQTAAARQHFHLVLACERLALTEDVLAMELDDIARRSGYSRRALELIFNRTVGMPPGRWFMNIRLNGVMRDLLTAAPNGNVSEVAMRWGFRHLARFASHYRRAFGELPSQTLGRSLSR